MKFFEGIRRAFSSKESQARIALVTDKVGKAVYTEANYEGFAKKGFQRNVIVYAAISKIATSCAGVNWVLYSGKGKNKTELETHPFLDLWARPNPLQSTSEFVESLIGFLKIAGNSYIEENVVKGKATELWPVRPDKVKIVPNARGFVQRYTFENGQAKRSWEVDQITLRASLAHWKTFNPLNDWYGQSPLQAAIQALDQNNAGQRWNLALLQNSAVPSGVLQMESTQGNIRGTLTDDQYTKLKKKLDEHYSGPANAGRPMILEGGLSWKAISLSPKEMEFIESKEVSATDLAIAFGVPPELMGLGEKTYANQKEARLAFWEDTNLPTMDALRDLLNYWLLPTFGPELYFDYDRDDIEALQYRREQKYLSLAPVKFLTVNEKREAVGYEPRDDGDVYDSGSVIATEETDDDETNEPKDPGQDDETNEETDDSEVTQDEENDDTEKSWKSINLLTSNEKRKSWQRQNAKRKSLSATFEKELKTDFKDLTRALQKTADAMKGADPKVIELALVKKADETLPDFAKTISRHTKYALDEFGNIIFKQAKDFGCELETKANLKYDQYVQSYIKRKTADHIKSISSTNEKTVKRIVKEWVSETITAGDSLPELSKYLEAEFEGLAPSRARNIARTEVSMASNSGTLEAVKTLQVPGLYKEWVTANDERVRDGDGEIANHQSMNGVSVALDDKFTVPPDTSMEGPGDDAGGPDQVCNCRCVLVFKQRGKS